MNLPIDMRRCGLLMAVVIVVALAAGCAETRHTMRSLDQHPDGHGSAMETTDKRVIELGPVYSDTEYIGGTYWTCSTVGDTLECRRICDDGSRFSRICNRDLHHEFGEVSEPGAGVVAAKVRTQMQREQDERRIADDRNDDDAGDEIPEEAAEDEPDESDHRPEGRPVDRSSDDDERDDEDDGDDGAESPFDSTGE